MTTQNAEFGATNKERRATTRDRRVAIAVRRRVNCPAPQGLPERRGFVADRRGAARDRRIPSARSLRAAQHNGNGHIAGNGNGNGHVVRNGNGHVAANGNGHVATNGNGNGNGHTNGNGHGHSNGNGNGALHGREAKATVETQAGTVQIVPITQPATGAVGAPKRDSVNALSTGTVSISVVIPTLNEARNLPHVLPQIPECVDEVILVDGRSVDGTVPLATELMPGIRVVEELRPGKGAALMAGFRAARGDIIVTLDADGSADPGEIPAFVGLLLSGADFAKGSRFLQGGGTRDMELLRKVGNWGLRTLVRLGFGGQYSDLCYGYNAFWRERVLPVIQGSADGFEIETLMNVRVLQAGLRVAEVPSFEAPRIHGESHLRTWRDGFRVLCTIARERRTREVRAECR